MTLLRAVYFFLAFAGFGLSAAAASGPSTEPEEDLLPIELTEEEKTRLHEIGINHRATAPPVGAIRNPAEWEPSEGVLVRWPLGIPVALVAEMSEDVVVTTLVASAAAEQSARTTYGSGGVNMANVEFVRAATNSIWVRDYGPWFIFADNQLAIVDHVYNRPRPLDDVIPQAIGVEWGLDVYGMDVIHTGGNHMSDGLGTSSSTELVYLENPSMTHDEVDQSMLDYLGNDYMVLDYIQPGGIHHIDCWAKFLGPSTVLVKDVPPGDPTYDDLNAHAEFLATRTTPWGVPYEVHRVYCPSGTFYTNSLILNDKVLVPLFGNSQDSVALETYVQAMPGYEVLGFTGSWASEDALHCRAMGVPDRGTLQIDHVPIQAGDISGSGYEIAATIVPLSGEPLLVDQLKLHYSIDGGLWEEEALSVGSGPDAFRAFIPEQPENSVISYYLEAADESGRVERHPYVGLRGAHQFLATCTTHPDVNVTPDGPLSVCAGESQLLSVSLTGGSGPFAYQWLEDGFEIPGATEANFVAVNTGTHTYNCRVSGAGCSSYRTDAEEIAVSWRTAPVFGGVRTVSQAAGDECRLDVAWDPATPACGGPVYYDVHRAISPFFTPDPSNRVISGVSGTIYSDRAELASGTHYYYAVRARDDSNGAVDANSVKRGGVTGETCSTVSACTMTVNVRPNGSTAACAGESILFTATPNGGVPPYTFQWTEDGAEIPGATSSSFAASHESAQLHTYNCRVTDSGLCENVTDGLNAVADWSNCDSVVTVPDGSDGATAPLLAAKSGDDLILSWDVTTPGCGSAGYHLVWGWGTQVRDYTVSGSDCSLGSSGSHLWTTAPDTGTNWSWFLVVGNDGATTEGGWGTDSSSNQRSLVASGTCGTTLIATAACF
jgi:agmatine deiminase